MTQTAGCLISC